jgi:protein-S-isoprenylcysteine O-methyltransferase Ste14
MIKADPNDFLDIDMRLDQIILAIEVIIFILPFAWVMVSMRMKGHDPKGSVGEHRWAAALTGFASLVWLLVILTYLIDSQSTSWFGRIALFDYQIIKGIGLSLGALGAVISTLGEFTLGASFRVALPAERTELITRGIYAVVRNPCVLGIYLIVLGTFLVTPSALALAAIVLNIIGYTLKVQAEEQLLRKLHGEAYEAYCRTTGRYFPRR